MPKFSGRGVARQKAGIKAPAAKPKFQSPSGPGKFVQLPGGPTPYKPKPGVTGRPGQMKSASGRAKK